MKPKLRTTLWCLFALAALTATTTLCITLIPIDETRYAGVALEMWQNGDFLVPRNNGAFYSDKPPLLFWLLQAGWALFGVSTWWARASVALCSGAVLAGTALLARRVWPHRERIARLAPMILLGSALWAAWTPAVMFDVLLSLCALVAVGGIVLQALGRPGAGVLLMATGIGLGVLTKGPVVLLHVLPVGLLAPVWHPGPRRWGRWYGGLVGGVLGGALIALAWAIPAALRGGPEYARAIFWGQSAGRMVESFAHPQPAWWYLETLPLILFPWFFWLPLWRGLPALCRSRDWAVVFVLCWILPAFVAFTFISGKQVHYLLPLFPAVALLIARTVEPQSDGAAGTRGSLPVAVPLLLLAGVAAWIPSRAAGQDWPAWTAALPMWPAILFVVLALSACAPLRRLSGRVMLLATASVGTVMVLMAGVVRPAFPAYDLTPVARLVAEAQARGQPVAHVGGYHNRLRFLGRLKRPVIEIGENDLVAWACTHEDGLVVRYYEDRDDIPRGEAALLQRPFRSDWVRVVRAGSVVVRDGNGRDQSVAAQCRRHRTAAE